MGDMVQSRNFSGLCSALLRTRRRNHILCVPSILDCYTVYRHSTDVREGAANKAPGSHQLTLDLPRKELLTTIGATMHCLGGIMKLEKVMARVFQIAQPMSFVHRLKTPPDRLDKDQPATRNAEVVISGMSTKVVSSLAEAPYEKYRLPKIETLLEGEGLKVKDSEDGEKPSFRDVQFYEVIMEALLDAGVNPGSLEGTDTGIFIGHSYSNIIGHDAPDSMILDSLRLTYLAQRIAMILKTRGKEQFFRLDQHSGYLLPLGQAVAAVHSGQCEAAVVACAIHDVAAVFIQKAPAALRPYAKLERVQANVESSRSRSGTRTDLASVIKSIRHGMDKRAIQESLILPAGSIGQIKLTLKSCGKDELAAGYRSEIPEFPLVIPYSSPSEEKVEDFLQNSIRNGNEDSAPLLHNIYKGCSLPGHKYRGYAIINQGESPEPELSTASSAVTTSFVTEKNREVWFIFPGLGSQFPGMGLHLMELAPFREAIQESAYILKTEGIDLLKILDPLNTEVNTSIRSAMVAITSVQIALVNLMTSLGIKPDGYIGYSCGEIMCAYCDGAFDTREALLVSKIYGECIQSVKIARGRMVAVGLSWNEVSAIMPPEVYVACNNSPNNVTIGGPSEAVESFVGELREKGVKTWPVNSCGFAPHSHSFSHGKGLLLSCLERVITAPIQRSPKWVSTSLHDEDTSEFSFYRQSSPMYYMNNLESPVLFHEAVGKIPRTSVVVEIGLSGMLQTVLSDSLEPDSLCLSLGRRKKNKHSVPSGGSELAKLMVSIGDIFNAGVPVDFSRLYLPEKFPVSSSPSLAQDFEWETENAWKEFGNPKPKKEEEKQGYVKLEELM